MVTYTAGQVSNIVRNHLLCLLHHSPVAGSCAMAGWRLQSKGAAGGSSVCTVLARATNPHTTLQMQSVIVTCPLNVALLRRWRPDSNVQRADPKASPELLRRNDSSYAPANRRHRYGSPAPAAHAKQAAPSNSPCSIGVDCRRQQQQSGAGVQRAAAQATSGAEETAWLPQRHRSASADAKHHR